MHFAKIRHAAHAGWNRSRYAVVRHIEILHECHITDAVWKLTGKACTVTVEILQVHQVAEVGWERRRQAIGVKIQRLQEREAAYLVRELASEALLGKVQLYDVPASVAGDTVPGADGGICVPVCGVRPSRSAVRGVNGLESCLFGRAGLQSKGEDHDEREVEALQV